ncbi:MAG: hypothetical protein PHP57_06405 [Sideroxydans sp.]|nr:hypothetical protein [Sideroxydans sp.]
MQNFILALSLIVLAGTAQAESLMPTHNDLYWKKSEVADSLPNPSLKQVRVNKTFYPPKAIEHSNDKWGENIYRLEAPKGYHFYKAGKGYLLIANEVQK